MLLSDYNLIEGVREADMRTIPFELKEVDLSKIEVNKNNPRGPHVRNNDDQFEYLKRSIKQFGLFVPLVIQKLSSKDEDRYRLIDGERRYWALRELGKKVVPAHIIDTELSADEARNIMFHIHTNRVQWDPCQQCKALEPLYEHLKDEYENAETKIAKEFINLTGTNKDLLGSGLAA